MKVEKGENDGLSAVFHLESVEFSEYKKGKGNEDFGKRHEAFKEPSRANNFLVIKFVPWRLKKFLATFWYNQIL